MTRNIFFTENIVSAAGLAFLMSAEGLAAASDHLGVEITNRLIRAMVYLPDVWREFYRGPRFEPSGVIYSLQAKT
jgi:hypothetical protein